MLDWHVYRKQLKCHLFNKSNQAIIKNWDSALLISSCNYLCYEASSFADSPYWHVLVRFTMNSTYSRLSYQCCVCPRWNENLQWSCCDVLDNLRGQDIESETTKLLVWSSFSKPAALAHLIFSTVCQTSGLAWPLAFTLLSQ